MADVIWFDMGLAIKNGIEDTLIFIGFKRVPQVERIGKHERVAWR